MAGFVLAACAALSAGSVVSLAVWAAADRAQRARRRRMLAEAEGAFGREVAFASQGLSRAVLEYAVRTSGDFSSRSVPGVSVASRLSAAASEKRAAAIRHAGLEGAVDVGSCIAAQIRLAVAGAFAGALAGLCLSWECAVVGLAGGGVVGYRLLPRALAREKALYADDLERCLPEMLDVVALGLRSGLSFDRSFALYHGHFASPFSRRCASAQRKWELGVVSRGDALRGLAGMYESALLDRAVGAVARSLRFGTSMAEVLEAAAEDARAVRKARKEERIAKVPVKMMLPTGALILPAMLLLVLGPVLLELASGF